MPPLLRSSPLSALAALVAVAAIIVLGRYRDHAIALEAEAAHVTPAASEPPPSVEALLAPIDVNHASTEELERLPRIGPALAARIVARRPFASVDDLRRVPGIGARTLERLRPHVVAGPR